jgi:hypothetical protein
MRGAALVAGIALLHAALVLGGNPLRHPSVDSYCHASFAADIAGGSLAPSMARMLPWTVFRGMDVDHYWGHHLLTAPFVGVFGQLLGMKVAAAFFFLLVPLAVYGVLRARRVPWAELLALLVLCAPTQDWRYLQLRGGAWAVALLVALLYVAFLGDFSRKARLGGLWLLGYVGMVSYHGGVVLLVFHGAGALWRGALDREARGLRLLEPLATLAGLVSGLLLNPYMDRRGSTFRFAWYHITRMGTDAEGLYTDWKRAEFQPFPLEVLLHSPPWLVLLGLTLGAAAWAVARRLRGRPVAQDELIFAGLALAGVVLTAKSLRMREYGVPVAVIFLGLAARPLLEKIPRRLAPLAPILGGLLALIQASTTLGHLSIERVHAGVFAEARGLLVSNGDAPILNLAESDCCMLRWEHPQVACVQGLSRYFLSPDRELYADVRELHEQADVSPRTGALLQKFRGRGVRLVVTHTTHKLHGWALRHPEALELVFNAHTVGAIWRILPPPP